MNLVACDDLAADRLQDGAAARDRLFHLHRPLLIKVEAGHSIQQTQAGDSSHGVLNAAVDDLPPSIW